MGNIKVEFPRRQAMLTIREFRPLFADAYCPDCRVRFEFQKVRKGKNDQNNLKRARKAFGGRA